MNKSFTIKHSLSGNEQQTSHFALSLLSSLFLSLSLPIVSFVKGSGEKNRCGLSAHTDLVEIKNEAIVCKLYVILQIISKKEHKMVLPEWEEGRRSVLSLSLSLPRPSAHRSGWPLINPLPPPKKIYQKYTCKYNTQKTLLCGTGRQTNTHNHCRHRHASTYIQIKNFWFLYFSIFIFE